MNEQKLNVDLVTLFPPNEITTPSSGSGSNFGWLHSPPFRVDNHLGVEIVVNYGAVSTSGGVDFGIQECQTSDGMFASVAMARLAGAEQLCGLPAAAVRTSGVDQNITRRIGYLGHKPWLRVGFRSTDITRHGAPASTFKTSVYALLKQVIQD